MFGISSLPAVASAWFRNSPGKIMSESFNIYPVLRLPIRDVARGVQQVPMHPRYSEALREDPLLVDVESL